MTYADLDLLISIRQVLSRNWITFRWRVAAMQFFKQPNRRQVSLMILISGKYSGHKSPPPQMFFTKSELGIGNRFVS